MAIQNFFTSRDNNIDSGSYVGQVDRLWYDPDTNSIYVSDGVSPGGIPVVSGGDAYSNANVLMVMANFGSNTISGFGNISMGNLAISNDAVILGNLRVTGNTTFISSNDLVVGNLNLILANSAEQASDANGAGIIVGNVSTDTYATILWRYTDNTWILSDNVQSNVATFATAEISGNVAAGGNITGNYFIGNGSQLSGIDATGIRNGTSNVRVAANGNVTVSVANVANIAIFTSDGANITGNFDVTGNVTGNYFFGNGSQLEGIDATSIQNGTSNVRVAAANGNVTVSVANVANVAVFTSDSANITGNLGVTGNFIVDMGNVGNTGNAANVSNLMVVNHSGVEINGNLTVNVINAANAANVDNVLTATFGNVEINGNLLPLANGMYSLGNSTRWWSNLWIDSNTIYIGGIPLGTSNDVLTVNGEPVLSNDSSTSITTTGNISAGNLTTDGELAVTGNLSGGNLDISGQAAIEGNLSAGNLDISGMANIVGNLSAGNLDISGLANVIGNIDAGNFVTEGNVTANYVVSGNVFGTSANVQLIADSQIWTFASNSFINLPGNAFNVRYANTATVDIAERFMSSWTVLPGTANYSFTVPDNNNYIMWVLGNIPNGIIVWNARVTISNTNVPRIGESYAWVYNAVSPIPIDFSSIPGDFVGTVNTIVRSNTGGTLTNVFTFGIVNNTTLAQRVDYGWIRVSKFPR